MPKKITTSERRHLDYLRRNGLKVGKVYMSRLQRLRHAEAARVLGLCRQMNDPATWPSVMETNISETYFPDWLSGLYSTAGMQHARSVERDLRRGKADLVDHPWESGLRSYATQRAGNEIVIVSGTMKAGLVGILRRLMETEPEMGIEKLAKRIQKEFDNLQRWECRRIAQTETMVGMAEAGRLAADSLDVPFVKQWAVSGLANTRDTHLAMDGVTVDQDDYFELPDCRMLYPHDNSLNPPASEIINCACDVLRRPK